MEKNHFKSSEIFDLTQNEMFSSVCAFLNLKLKKYIIKGNFEIEFCFKLKIKMFHLKTLKQNDLVVRGFFVCLFVDKQFGETETFSKRSGVTESTWLPPKKLWSKNATNCIPNGFL